jgi:uncharacterized protein (TIGR03435 family)
LDTTILHAIRRFGKDSPSLFVALQEQFGLKLEAVRAPVEVLVIDSAERAMDN